MMIDFFIKQGALFVVNHSGGKDSQAMTAYLSELVPENQLLVVHAHLPEVEWDGVRDHIKNTIGNLEYQEVQAGKTFFQMVEHRGKFPSSATRQCTSDLKRGPIEVLIRRVCKERGITWVVNCMGLRAEESTNRAKKAPFRMNKELSKAGRKVYNWLPIHRWTISMVWDAIHNAGQKGHWAYAAGMSRLSCCFCIMASKEDLRTAARLKPELFERYTATERKLNFTLLQPAKGKAPLFLDELIKQQ